MLVALTVVPALLPSTAVAADATTASGGIDQSGMPNPRHMWTDGADGDAADDVDAADGTGSAAGARAADYAPSWKDGGNGYRTFYDGYGSEYLPVAFKVIDVSEWNDVDWSKIDRKDVDGVLLRAGYGIDNVDRHFAGNLAAVRKLGIPFGVYWYSYAYDADFAADEGASVANTLKRYGVTAGELSLPIYYDLEAWSWAGHAHPTTPAQYEPIMNAFVSAAAKAGYGNVDVYSYTSYLDSALKSSAIWKRTSWVAQYGPKLTFTGDGSGVDGTGVPFNWQYTSSGTVSGINGHVDLSAFSSVGKGLGGFADVHPTTPHLTDILWLSSTGVSTGWTDNTTGAKTFRGDASIVRQDMAAFLYRLAGSPKFTVDWSKNPFEDVTAKTPHYKEVLWLASTGITTGWKDGKTGKATFRGDASIVRQDMAAFLNRYAAWAGDKKAASWQPYDNGGFGDVSVATPHRREVLWLATHGISTGWTESDGSTTFRGGASVVRQDMAAFLHRLEEYLGKR